MGAKNSNLRKGIKRKSFAEDDYYNKKYISRRDFF